MTIKLISNYHPKPHKGILQEPHSLLRMVSKPEGTIDKSVKVIAEELIKTLKRVDKPYNPWLGMSAPQIGYSRRIIAIKGRSNTYLVMVNPKVINKRFHLPALSGCFSLKGLYLIKRYYLLRVKYQNLSSKEHIRSFFGGSAVVLQQEIEHLDGKLICD